MAEDVFAVAETIVGLREGVEAAHRARGAALAEAEAVRQDITALREYHAALEAHVRQLEERLQALREETTPEEVQVHRRVAEVLGRLEVLEERRRQAETITQQDVETVARWLARVRGGQAA